MEVKVKIEGLNPQQTMNRILNHRVQVFTAETIQRYMNQFVPMRTGMLSQTFIIRQSEPYGIEYIQPYARRMYYGDGFHFRRSDKDDYNKDGTRKKGVSLEFHPKAQSRWAEPVNANYKPVIAKEVTASIKRGNYGQK